MKHYRKFIVAAAGVLVAQGLIDSETADTIVSVATALLVYFVPNAE